MAILDRVAIHNGYEIGYLSLMGIKIYNNGLYKLKQE